MKINKKDFIKARVHVTITPGAALKMIRELQDLSQNNLAKLTGIPQSNISAIENGTDQLGRERTIILARALKVHPAVLLFPDYQVNEVA